MHPSPDLEEKPRSWMHKNGAADEGDLLNEISLLMSILTHIRLSGQCVPSRDSVSIVTYANLVLYLNCMNHSPSLLWIEELYHCQTSHFLREHRLHTSWPISDLKVYKHLTQTLKPWLCINTGCFFSLDSTPIWLIVPVVTHQAV